MKWNMPYGALKRSNFTALDHVSPRAVAASPASDLVATTPAAYGVLSPPAESPSGLSQALRNKTVLERAYLFMEDKHDELIRSMEPQERVFVPHLLLCPLATLIGPQRYVDVAVPILGVFVQDSKALG